MLNFENFNEMNEDKNIESLSTIKFTDIKPIGNFESILIRLRENADEVIDLSNKDKEYKTGLSKGIKTICAELNLIEVLEEGYQTGKTWNIRENLQCLLYTHLIIIDLNQTAHTYLNKITEWNSPTEQLQELLDDNPDIYKGLKITE